MVVGEGGLRGSCHSGQETHILCFVSLKIKGLPQNYKQEWVKANAKTFAFETGIQAKGAHPDPCQGIEIRQMVYQQMLF